MAGYSNTPLVRKLSIKSGHRLALTNAPAEFAETLQPLPDKTQRLSRPRQAVDIQLCFCLTLTDLRRCLPTALKRLPADGALWIAWPKKQSPLARDLDFTGVQQTGLAADLVDNKICAIDETWSGLRLVVPRARRAKWPGAG